MKLKDSDRFSYEDVASQLSYFPETGEFAWVAPRRGRKLGVKFKGNHAGERGTYSGFTFCGMQVLAHRFAYLLYHKHWPEYVDHINGDRKDNRICNLRAVSKQENQRNFTPRSRKSIAGIRLRKDCNRWEAYVGGRGKQQYLGMFTDEWDAICARQSALNARGFHPNHGRALCDKIVA